MRKHRSAHTVLHDLANNIMLANMLHGRMSTDPLNTNNKSYFARKYPKVGGMIESLPAEDRKALKSLTSAEAADVRVEYGNNVRNRRNRRKRRG